MHASISAIRSNSATAKIDELSRSWMMMPQNFRIDRTSHAQNIEYRQQPEAQAIKAAKEKGCPYHRRQAGEAITITKSTGNTGNACFISKE